MVLSKKQTAKVLIRLGGCAGWSAPVLFTNLEDRFSQVEAHIKEVSIDTLSYFYNNEIWFYKLSPGITGPRSAVCNVYGNRCESDCRSWGRKFDPRPRSHTFVEIDHEIISMVILLPSKLLSDPSESMCKKYWLTARSSLPRKKCGMVNLVLVRTVKNNYFSLCTN